MVTSLPAPKRKNRAAKQSPPKAGTISPKKDRSEAGSPALPAEGDSSIKAANPESASGKKAKRGSTTPKIERQKGKKKKKLKKPALMDMSTEGNLAVEAHHLRIILREISSRFLSDLESEIVRIVGMISQVSDKEKKQAELRSILKQMQSLRLRSDRGKLSDLRRIRNLVERVTSRLEELI